MGSRYCWNTLLALCLALLFTLLCLSPLLSLRLVWLGRLFDESSETSSWSMETNSGTSIPGDPYVGFPFPGIEVPGETPYMPIPMPVPDDGNAEWEEWPSDRILVCPGDIHLFAQELVGRAGR